MESKNCFTVESKLNRSRGYFRFKQIPGPEDKSAEKSNQVSQHADTLQF
jgi:hypothetical protein